MDYTPYFKKAVKATRDIIQLSAATVNQVLHDLAALVILKTDEIMTANQLDLDKMDPADPKYDRLKLTAQRILDIAKEIAGVAELKSPLGKLLSKKTMPNGLQLSKITVPLGVIGVIYEARPNVTFDVFSLCFKTGNVCLLKGGSDAHHSNQAIIGIIHEVLAKHNISINMASLLPPGRDATDALLNGVGYVDVLIPRGSQQLINHVRQHSKVPVIETGAGIVHTYFDETGDVEKGSEIICNAKTRRVSVCNALDCLIIHQSRLTDLPALSSPLAEKAVEIFADKTAYAALVDCYPAELLKPAQPEHFGTEFLALRMSVKTVANLQEALDHISTYSSKHSEAIITEDEEHIATFLNSVDAAAVYINTSTAFTDGAQFGLGAEIGISTQKLHARGPMGLQELTSYKWLVKGNGQTRKG